APWRQKVLKAVARRDWNTVEKLVSEVKEGDQEPVFFEVLVGAFLFRPGPNTTGLELLRRIQCAHPGDLWANIFYALALVKATPRQSNGAIHYIQAALALRPRNSYLHFYQGVLFVDIGDLDAAIAEFWQAIALGANYTELRNALGNALTAKKEYDTAVAVFRDAIRRDPNAATLHNGLGIALAGKKEHDAAMAQYKEAIGLDPKFH